MSIHHESAKSPGPESPATRQDTSVSRRSIIRGAAGLAGAGLAAGAIGGAITGAIVVPARSAPSGQQARGGAIPTEPVVVHVRDVAKGVMDVFAGTSHARLTDPGLAASLVRGVS
jgi:hypothetical protein